MNLSSASNANAKASRNQVFDGPRETATLLLTEAQVKEATRLLSLGTQEDLEDEAATLMTFKAPFEGGWYAEFNVVNSDAGPFLQGALRAADGAPLVFIDDTQELLGEHLFEVAGRGYAVTLQEERPEASEPTSTGLRGRVAEAQKPALTSRDLAVKDICLWLEKAGADAEWLDDLVHDVAAENATGPMNQEDRESAKERILAEHEHRASDINNGGLDTQVGFLVTHLGVKDARKQIAKSMAAALGNGGRDEVPTPSAPEAKARVKALLEAMELPFEKLTSKQNSFSGLGYGTAIFVKIHGWKPNPALKAVEDALKGSHIVIQVD
jgi:hypothetical protein